jgi:hypothetical protein
LRDRLSKRMVRRGPGSCMADSPRLVVGQLGIGLTLHVFPWPRTEFVDGRVQLMSACMVQVFPRWRAWSPNPSSCRLSVEAGPGLGTNGRSRSSFVKTSITFFFAFPSLCSLDLRVQGCRLTGHFTRWVMRCKRVRTPPTIFWSGWWCLLALVLCFPGPRPPNGDYLPLIFAFDPRPSTEAPPPSMNPPSSLLGLEWRPGRRVQHLDTTL